MNKEKLQEIENKMNKLKVIGYKETKLKSESRFIDIIKGIYNLNNGKIIDREKTVKKIGSSNATVVFAMTKENNIILVIQPRTSLPTKDKMSIELPAGYIDKEEDGLKAAKRELEEETGYTSNNLILLDSYYPSLGASSERIDLVIALDCIHTKDQHLDTDEFVEYIEVTKEEFKYLLNNNYIKDANSRIGYYKALEYLNR